MAGIAEKDTLQPLIYLSPNNTSGLLSPCTEVLHPHDVIYCISFSHHSPIDPPASRIVVGNIMYLYYNCAYSFRGYGDKEELGIDAGRN
jgi:hypothetical protein